MFEHHTQPLATQSEFARRMLRFGCRGGIILFSLVDRHARLPLS